VVFTGEGADRKATILDFKTNAMRQGETVEAYETRLREAYTPQMEAYRRAVHMLTGIPIANVSAKLLLTRSRSIVDVYGFVKQ
jgi:ATP-dependent exoDNAse (exonuclease V) beta subunit